MFAGLDDVLSSRNATDFISNIVNILDEVCLGQISITMWFKPCRSEGICQ